MRTFHAYAFGLLRRAAVERGEPPPRLLTGPEQDLVIRELLADRARTAWPEALRPALRTRAFAAQLRDLLLRAAERGVGPERAGRARGGAPAAPTGRPRPGFLREYVQVLALRDATGRAGLAYDPAELVRAAAGLLRDEPDAAGRPSGGAWPASTSTSWPTPTRPSSTCSHLVAGGGHAPGRVRRPGLLDLRLPGRRPRWGDPIFRTGSGAATAYLTAHLPPQWPAARRDRAGGRPAARTRSATGACPPIPAPPEGVVGGAHVPLGGQRGGLRGAPAARGPPARRGALVADGGAWCARRIWRSPRSSAPCTRPAYR